MAQLLSPGVNVTEIDLTTIVPSVSTSTGAFAGLFRWGPVGERVLVDSETQLVSRFAKPTTFNAETFFTAANFLSYTNTLYVVRAANTTGAVAQQTFNVTVADTNIGNNVFVVKSGNTHLLSNGIYVTQVANNGFPKTDLLATGNSVYIENVINSTAIQLSTNIYSTCANLTLYFANPQTTYSAVALEQDGVTANLVNQIVTNENDYLNKKLDSEFNYDPDVRFIAKYPGAIGNTIRVSMVDNANQFASSIDLHSNTYTITRGSNNLTVFVTGDDGSNAQGISDKIALGDQIRFGNTAINYQYMKVTGISDPVVNATGAYITLNFETPYRLHTAYTSNSINRHWEFFSAVKTAPGVSEYQRQYGNSSIVDEVHLVVVDENGMFTGTPGEILETFKGLSRATDAKTPGGVNNYYADVVNMNSKYIWWASDRGLAPSSKAEDMVASLETEPADYQMTLGADGEDEENVSLSTIATAYDLFASTEDITIDIVLQGKPIGDSILASSTGGLAVVHSDLANYLIDNILHNRKDCVGCISPDKTMTLNAFGQEAINLAGWRGGIHDSSYAILDSGYKYQYDRYNDVYRWIPLNGDIGGLMARTDHTNDAWWSPAGLNRGHIKNLVKLAYNPRQADRDLLYVNGINPVVTFPGKGTILFGDKTLQAKPSAFDRINVRRLFLVLERAISIASRYYLFEFNDQFTRSQFKNLVTPYLRTIQGRRGITDFLVVCDDTNNTPQIIDSNQFVGDIYIKPARSINFIQLNFIAVATGVQFSEVVGKF